MRSVFSPDSFVTSPRTVPAEGFLDVPAVVSHGADQPVVGAVGDEPVSRVELDEEHALGEHMVLEELVELGAAGRAPAGGSRTAQRAAQNRARDHARFGGGRALGLNRVEVADDEQDRGRCQSEGDADRDREAENESRGSEFCGARHGC